MNLRPRRFVCAVAALVAVGVLAPTTLASASPIDDKKAEAARLQAQIDANGNRMEVLSEQYNGAVYRLQQAQQSIAEAHARVASAKAETDRLTHLLNGRAADLYKQAGAGDNSDTSNVSDQSARKKYAQAAASNDNSIIADLQKAQEDLAVQTAMFQASKDAAQHEKDSIASSQKQLSALNAKQTALLSQTKGELAVLIKQDEARKAAAIAAAARAEQARRPAAAQAARAASSGGGGRADAARAAAGDVARPPAPSPGAQAAVDYAMAQVGKPYQYGAAGPDSFDCSGLTMMAWRAGGVSMPHYSGAQATMFPRVPDDQIQPGDLLLYYSDLHHVAIAINGSQEVTAPHTGDVVKIAPIFRSGYEFAVRPG